MLGVTDDNVATYFRETDDYEIREYPVQQGAVETDTYCNHPATSLEGYINAHTWDFVNRLVTDELNEARIRHDLNKMLDTIGDTE